MSIALIHNGVVSNFIVADIGFARQLPSVDTAVDVSGITPAPQVGWSYDGTNFHAPQVLSSVLMITGVTSDNTPATAVDMVNMQSVCPIGTTLTFAGKLVDGSGNTLTAVTATFNMPINQRDGRQGMLLATISSGILSVVAPFKNAGDDGCWTVDQTTINASLPAAQQMTFGGWTAFVHR